MMRVGIQVFARVRALHSESAIGREWKFSRVMSDPPRRASYVTAYDALTNLDYRSADFSRSKLSSASRCWDTLAVPVTV